MKTIIINLAILLTVMIVAFQIGVSYSDTHGDHRTSNEKAKDCVAQGGEYYLAMEQDSRWNYERCDIKKTIKY